MSRTIRWTAVAAAAALLVAGLTSSAEAAWPRRVTTFYSYPTVPVAVGTYAPVGAAPYMAASPVVASPYVAASPIVVQSPVVAQTPYVAASPVVVPMAQPIVTRRNRYYAPYVPTVVAPVQAYYPPTVFVP